MAAGKTGTDAKSSMPRIRWWARFAWLSVNEGGACGKAKTTAAIDASCKLVRERLWRAGKLGARGRGLPRAT